MKALKIVGIGFAALLLLTIIGVAVIVAKFDGDLIKTELTKAVLEKKQRTLKIDGPLDLAFWPSLGVRVGNVSLSEHRSDKTFLRLESARVSVALIPLLSKQIVIDAVEIAGANATLVRNKDGRLSIADLLSKDRDESPLVKIDIAGIGVSNSHFVFRDDQAGVSYGISGLTLTTGHLANAAEGALKLAAKVTVSKPTTAAEVNVKGRYRYDLDNKDYALTKLEASVRGELSGAKGLDLKLTAASLALQPSTQSVAIDQLTLNAAGKQGADSFEVKLEAPKLAVTPVQASGGRITLVATLTGVGRNVTAKLGLSGVEGSASAVKIAKLDLDLDAKVGETSAKGKLSGPASVQMDVNTFLLPTLVGDFEIANPQMPMKQVKLPINGTVRVDWVKQRADVALNTRFDESKIAAKVNLAKFSTPDIGFDLDIDQINVDKYFPPEKKGAAGSSAAETPIDLSALKTLTLRGAVKVGQLQVQNVKASSVRLNVDAAGGKLDLAPMSMQLYEGQLNGALSVNANGNTVAAKLALAEVNILPLMKDVVEKELLEGRGTVNLDLNTRGATVSAMKKTLAGTASLSLRDGAIKGIDLAKQFRELKANFSSQQDAVQAAKKSDKTDFAEMSGSFKIANGVARNDDLIVKSPFLRLRGNGDIDVGNGSIDYLVKASVVNTAGGQGSKDLDHLKGLTVPVRLTGPLENMSYRLELGSLVQDAAKAKVEEAKQELQKKATEKLQDQLRGLFKR